MMLVPNPPASINSRVPNVNPSYAEKLLRNPLSNATISFTIASFRVLLNPVRSNGRTTG